MVYLLYLKNFGRNIKDLNNSDFMMKGTLSPEQKSACERMENMLLTACPGSGKTRTRSYKLAFLVSQVRDSRCMHIAIT